MKTGERRRMMRKKADAVMMWPVVLIVVSLIFLIFFLLFIKKNTDTAQSSSVQTACRASVEANAKFNTDINCPVQFVKIKTSKQEDAKKRLADEMVRCWDDYGMGKLKLFSAEDTKFCAVCSVVSFKNTPDLDNFPLFLASKSFNRQGQRISYYEYLSGVPVSAEALAEMAKMADDYLDTSYKYAVLFTFYKETEDTSWITILAAIGAGVLVAGAVALTVVTAGAAAPTIAISAAVAGSVGVVGGAVAGKEIEKEVRTGVGASLLGAEWDAGVIITLLNESNIRALGCEELPVSLTGIEQESQQSQQP